jgi:hypothetical protein
MVRLVFRPYTQIWRSICTSESLRASTRVSSGFTLFKYSSPSFGSQQICSYSNLSKNFKIGRWCPLQVPSLSLSFRMWVWHPNTRIYVRLLGPCFKTGRIKPFCQHPKHKNTEASGCRLLTDTQQVEGRQAVGSTSLFRKKCAADLSPDRCVPSVAKHHKCGYLPQRYIHQPKLMLTPLQQSAPYVAHKWTTLGWFAMKFTDFMRFPFNNFTYYLTLFSKFFSSFPHGTCSLSVSRHYLALDEIYHPICTAFPNNATLWTCITWQLYVSQRRDFHPLWYPVPKDLYQHNHRKHVYRLQLGVGDLPRFQIWALPASLAVTRGILVSFFSSAY